MGAAGFRNRIVAAGMPGMAAHQAPGRQVTAPEEPKAFDGLHAVSGAGWIETAGLPEHGADKQLVAAQQQQGQRFQHNIFTATSC